MTETMPTNQRYLKNIHQIGSPSGKDKIYIEKQAYTRIHQEDFQEKRVFVLMGHTENGDEGYTTFVDGVIPVRDIDFSKSTPKWDNRSWNDVFQEIKRAHEDEIIVGWAVDMRGANPKVTEDLEAIHRAQFGGAHQVLFLTDTLEGEECFYYNKKNHLEAKSGFYIYQKRTQGAENPQITEKTQTLENPSASPQVEVELPKEEPRERRTETSKPRYRELLLQDKIWQKTPSPYRAYVSAAMILILIGAIGVGVVGFGSQKGGWDKVVATLAGNKKPAKPESETSSAALGGSEDSEDSEIPINKIPSNLGNDTQGTAGSQNPTDSEQPSGTGQGANSGQPSGTGQDVNSGQPSGTGQDANSGQSSGPGQTAGTGQDANSGQPSGSGQDANSGQPSGSEQPVISEQPGGAKPPTESEKPDMTKPGSSEQATQTGAEAGYIIHTVSARETLYGICRKYQLSPSMIPEICELNRIENPDDIRVGQKIKIPQ